jgi:hypothetical protein
MPNDFSAEYSERSDDELLHLASERHSLTAEATARMVKILERLEPEIFQSITSRYELLRWNCSRRKTRLAVMCNVL